MIPFRTPPITLAAILATATAALSQVAVPAEAAPIPTDPTQPASHFTHWPAGTTPEEIGTRLTENFLPRKFRCQTVPDRAKAGIIYPEVVTWYGALTFAAAARKTDLTQRLITKFEPLRAEPGSSWINPSAHVDFRVFAALPLEIHLQTQANPDKALGLGLADAQWLNPSPDGITAEARYWIDDMYMITLVQVQAWRATRDSKYLDRAALTMVAYLDRLQQPNGLFHHGPDSPFFWSRGNGWMAAGSAELLRALPAEHPHRARILASYRTMMATLLANQADNGLWRQLIDQPDSWTETSGSAMFAFAFVSGVKHGWLEPATYGPAARKAWLGLVSHLDENANLRDVCVGTNKAKDRQFYLDRPRATGDLHGQAPMLWTATALIR